METTVLDSYAMMAFFQDEPGAEIVHVLLLETEKGKIRLVMSVVNLGEVWYSIARTTSPEIADGYIRDIHGMAIEIVDADWQLTRQAAVYKASGNIAYADCFAAALAKTQAAALVTGDREFEQLAQEIKITWL